MGIYGEGNPKVGHHIILDFHNCTCEEERLKDLTQGEHLLHEILVACDLTTLGIHAHQFNPYSYTALALIAESHLSVHTWTDEKFVSLDAFTCNGEIPEEFVKRTLNFYKPQHYVRHDIHRGGEVGVTSFLSDEYEEPERIFSRPPYIERRRCKE